VHFSYCINWLSSNCLCISPTVWTDYHQTVCAFLLLYELIIIKLSVHFSYCINWLSSNCLCISPTVWTDYHQTVCAFLVISSTFRFFHSKRFSFLLLNELSWVWNIRTRVGITELFLLCLQHVSAPLGHYELVQYKASIYIYILYIKYVNGEHYKSRCQSVELLGKISMYCSTCSCLQSRPRSNKYSRSPIIRTLVIRLANYPVNIFSIQLYYIFLWLNIFPQPSNTYTYNELCIDVLFVRQ